MALLRTCNSPVATKNRPVDGAVWCSNLNRVGAGAPVALVEVGLQRLRYLADNAVVHDC